MKRVIEGVTYNTDTAAIVARWEYEDENGYDTEATLYRTRGGAFFIVHLWTVDEKQKAYFEAVNRDGVQRVLDRANNLEILNEAILDAPPEAEASPSATLYVRLPSGLKDRLETLAKQDGLSLNAWTMRCVERCGDLYGVGQRLGEILQTGLSFKAGYPDSQGGVCMIDHMHEQAEAIAGMLGFDPDELAANGSDGYHWHHQWRSAEELEEE